MNLAERIAAIDAAADDREKKSLQLFLAMSKAIIATTVMDDAAEALRGDGPIDRETLARHLAGATAVILRSLDNIVAVHTDAPPSEPLTFH